MRGGADHFQVDNDDYDGEEVSLHEEIAEENRKLGELAIERFFHSSSVSSAFK